MNKTPIRSRKNTRASEYIRIFMLFFTFFLVYLGVSSVSYVTANNRAREDLRLQVAKNLSEQTEWMDGYIQKVYTASYSFLSNDNTAALLRSAAQNEQDTITNSSIVRSVLNLKTSIYDHVFYEFLLSKESNVYYDYGMCTPELYFDKLYRHSTMDAESWKITASQSPKMQVLPSDTVTEKYGATKPRTIIPIAVSRNISGRRWLLVTQVSAASISEMMEESRPVEAQDYFCVDSRGSLVFNTTTYQFDQGELQALGALAANVPIYIDESYQMGRDQYYLVGQKGVGGLTYFTVVSNGMLATAVAQRGRPLLFFFLLAMVLFFVLTLIYTQRLYHPLHNVVQLMNRLQTTENGKGSAFNFTRLGQLDALYQQKEDALIDSFDDGVRTLAANGEFPPDSRFQKRLLKNARLSDSKLSCLALRFSFREAYYNEFGDEEQEVVSRGLGQLLAGVLSGDFYCYVTEYERGSFACFFNSSSGRRQRLDAALRTLRDLFQYDAVYCSIRGGLSGEKDGPLALSDSLMEALTAIGFVKEDGDAPTLSEYVPETVCFQPLFGQKERNQLLVLLKNGEEEPIREFVESLKRETEETHLYYPLYRLLLRQLTDTGREYLYSRAMKPGTAESGDFSAYQTVREILNQNRNTLSAEFSGILRFLTLCAQTGGAETPETPRLEPVFAFIESHLSEDLYLERIATEAGLNPKYLSRSFKEKTGSTLSEYISLARVAKAKVLLCQSGQSVGEIGEAVGFENRTTFFRTFKKHEGVSPNDYRKMNPPS